MPIEQNASPITVEDVVSTFSMLCDKKHRISSKYRLLASSESLYWRQFCPNYLADINQADSYYLFWRIYSAGLARASAEVQLEVSGYVILRARGCCFEHPCINDFRPWLHDSACRIHRGHPSPFPPWLMATASLRRHAVTSKL